MVPSPSQHRMACAALIEQRIKILAHETGIPPCACNWNLNQGWENAGPHRLDIDIKDGTVKVYFTDAELMAYDEFVDREKTDVRLRYLLNELEEDALLATPAWVMKRLARGIRP